MKLVIQGTAYDMGEAIQKATISDLILLKRATKSKDYPGVSVKTIMATLNDAGEDGMDLLDSEAGLENLRGIIYLCRRRAGEKLSLEEAVNFPLTEMTFESDEDDEEDPKEKGTPSARATKGTS